jgi:hypothetical protein
MSSAGLETPVAKIDFVDCLFIFAVVFLAILFTWNCLPRPPLEDAAIVLRYAKNLAAGYGIVWNPGAKPVDGTTDFLFLLMVGGLVKAGLQPQAAARILDLVAHGLTIALIYLAVRKRGVSTRWAALISASYLGIGPAIVYIWDAFGTPVFGLCAGLTWWLALKIKDNGNSHLNCTLFALCGLVTALERPEGLFLASFMLLALVYLKGFQRSGLAILYFLCIVGIGGGYYFYWHWHYFGYPLPNPFYIRGGGHLYWAGLHDSLKNIVTLSGPFALVYLLALCSAKTRKLAAFSLIPIGGFGLLWVLITSEMNHFMRYQYAILPIMLLSWHPLWQEVHQQLGFPSWEDLRNRNCAPSPLLLAALWSCLLFYRGNYWSDTGKHWWDSNYDMGVMLSQFKQKHYTLATSEAGLLCFYSDWRSIDTWGLNESWIAHHGTITDSMLENANPEVIIFHAYFSPIVQSPYWMPASWGKMVMTLKGYAERKGYRLVGAFGEDPHDTSYVYVRQDFADGPEISERFRTLMDGWNKRAVAVVNFADFAKCGLP